MGAEEKTAEIEVEAGKAYDLEVRFSNFKQLHSTSPYVSVSPRCDANRRLMTQTGRRGGIRIGGRPKRNPVSEIEKAVKLARESDGASNTRMVYGRRGPSS
jgi:beta-glucosidase